MHMQQRAKPSLAQEIADFLNPAPRIQEFEAVTEVERVNKAKLVNYDDYLQDAANASEINVRNKPTTLRLLPEVVLGPKYAGVKTTRERLREEGFEEGFESLTTEIESDKDEDVAEIGKTPATSEKKTRTSYISDEEEEEEESGGEEEDFFGVQENGENEERMEKELEELEKEERVAVAELVAGQNRELEKATHVKNQKLIWNQILDIRIALQKLLNSANRMPKPDMFSHFLEYDYKGQPKRKKPKLTAENTETNGSMEEEKSTRSQAAESVTATKELLSDLIELQDELRKRSAKENNEESEGNTLEETRKRKRDSATDELWEELKKINDDLFVEWNPIIEKWNRRIQLSSGAGMTRSGMKALNRGPLAQIEQMLENKERLIRRTQLKRAQGRIIGTKHTEGEENKSQGGKEEKEKKREDDKYDAEIYDDADFYNQLLREFIESGTADISDPVALGRKHVQLKTLKERRQKQRDVDTKRSKGRKIRYDVHPLLVNFVPPMEVKSEFGAAEELFASLFQS